MSAIPAGESAAIRVTDLSNAKIYSYQAIHSMPFASIAETSKQLMQYGASNGQVLVWNTGSNNWVPTTLAGGGGGTVTTVSGTLPISVATGSSTPVVSISQADTSTSGYLSSADWNTFNSKQGALPAGGTSAHYYRGDNSWQTLDTSVVPENTNLYFTNARALGVPLSGFTTATGAIVDTDTAIQAFGKAQGQINSLVTDSSKYLIKNSTDSITGIVNVGTIGLLQLVYTPVGLNDATNKAYVDSEVGTKISKTGDTMSGVLTLDNDLKIKGGSNHVTIKGHTASANYNLALPQTAGTAGYVLSTDGSGNTSWVSPTVGSSSITDGSIVDADVNASAAIAQSKILNLTTDLAGKQPLISAGTTAQYYRGDKTFVDLGADVRGTTLTGYAVGTNTALSATDTTLTAFQNLQGQINATNTAVAGKEASLTAGSSSQYYRGDKSWQTLDGSVVANTAAGTIAATNVQSALNELDNEKEAKLISTSTVDARELRFYELTGNGSSFTSLKSPDALSADINYIFPSVAPTAGQVLSSNAVGVMSWITIPSAPVTTVHGRSGAVVAGNGDYTASQITNVSAGTIAATTVQAALDEIASEKEPLLTNPSDTTKYYRGDKTWSTFATDAINSVLSTFALNAGAKPAVANTDTVVGAFGKVQKTLNDINSDYVSKSANQTINGTLAINSLTGFITVPTPVNPNDAVNKSYVDGFGQWAENGSDINYGGGNVGIGTTSPGSPLEVVGVIHSTSGGIKFPDGSIQVTAAGGGGVAGPSFSVHRNGVNQTVSTMSWQKILFTTEGFDTNNNFDTTTSRFTPTVAGKYLVTGSAYCSGSSANCYVGIFKNGSVITENGNTTGGGPIPLTSIIVSMNGTTDYLELFVYTADPNVGGQGRDTNFSGSLLAPLGNGSVAGTGTAGYLPLWTNSTTQGSSVIAQNAGYVGIGTASPTQKLSLQGTSVSGATAQTNISAFAGNGMNIAGSISNSSQDAITYASGGGGGAAIAFRRGSAYETYLDFYTNNTTTPGAITQAMTITNGGSVGIGTNSPIATLEVNGAITTKGGEIIMQRPVIGGGWARGLHFVPDGSTNATAQGLAGIGLLGTNTTQTSIYLTFGTAPWTSSTGMQILANGNVGIGTTSPSYKLDVQGGGVNASGGFTQVSDIRLKTNIENLTSKEALEKITSLNGIYYDWKDQDKFGFDHQIGLVAQEVEKVFPEAVKTNKNGFLSVSYSNLVAPVIESIKALNAQKADVSKVKALEIENNKLKQENAAIKAYLCKKDPSATICK